MTLLPFGPSFFRLAFAVTWSESVQAQTLPEPVGEIILTVTGQITQTNASGAARFDHTMLAALGPVSFDTTTIWTDGVQTFTGIPLAVIVAHVGAQGATIAATALNDYRVEIPMSDAVEGGPILAYSQNGDPLSARDKGPIWLIYPYDSNSAYRSDVVYARSIWQLDRMDITP